MSDYDYNEEGFEETAEEKDSKVEEVITKEGMEFMTKTVLFSFAFIVIYTVWTQVALVVWKVEPNDTLTEWVYKFFGLELTLMFIKKITDKRLIKKKEKNSVKVKRGA